MSFCKSLKQMVPGSGGGSNPKSQLLAEWKKKNKQDFEALNPAYEPELEQLFDTLAEWNDYLENHIPYFQKPREPEL